VLAAKTRELALECGEQPREVRRLEAVGAESKDGGTGFLEEAALSTGRKRSVFVRGYAPKPTRDAPAFSGSPEETLFATSPATSLRTVDLATPRRRAHGASDGEADDLFPFREGITTLRIYLTCGLPDDAATGRDLTGQHR